MPSDAENHQVIGFFVARGRTDWALNPQADAEVQDPSRLPIHVVSRTDVNQLSNERRLDVVNRGKFCRKERGHVCLVLELSELDGVSVVVQIASIEILLVEYGLILIVDAHYLN